MTEYTIPGAVPPLKAEARDLHFYYGGFQALKGISMPIYEKRVTSLIGPSGCGKSTYLRCFNRMHDLYPGNRYEGSIEFYPDRTDLLSKDVDPIEVRMRISMVFQKPNPFPMSVRVCQSWRTWRTSRPSSSILVVPSLLPNILRVEVAEVSDTITSSIHSQHFVFEDIS